MYTVYTLYNAIHTLYTLCKIHAFKNVVLRIIIIILTDAFGPINMSEDETGNMAYTTKELHPVTKAN